MNYKVLKRPMFRIGGGVDSQGTGITSGMDMPRKNFEHGGPHNYDYWSSKVPEAFEAMRSVLGPATLIKGAEALRNVGSIWDIPGALGSPEMLGAVGSGLVADKKLDLQEATTMSKLTKPSDKTFMFQRRLNTARALRQKIKDHVAGGGSLNDSVVKEWEEDIGYLLGSQTLDEFLKEAAISQGNLFDKETMTERWREITGQTGDAAGGIPTRVNRVGLQESFPGTAGDAQQVMQPAQNMQGMTTGQNQAMTQDPYQILRRRLPPEVSDDVVRLIAYNKEAFQDFANIQTQDDVTMFNDKWGVQLVVDVGSA